MQKPFAAEHRLLTRMCLYLLGSLIAHNGISVPTWPYLAEIKGNQVECIRITEERFRKHFRRDVSPLEMAEIIDKALEYYQQYLDRKRDER